MVAFSVADEEKIEIDNYARVKHFGDTPHLARKALFAFMEKNKIGGHHAAKDAGAVVRPAPGGQEGGEL
jgi:hypothetical protein